jgi:mRNA deadenylase 3'-5' endonuclease subunit Ccr4
MKSQTIEELIMFLCTSRFDIKEREAKLLEKFFSYKEMESVKEEKDKNLDEIEIDLISNTEEQDTILNNEIGLDEVDEADEEDEAQISLPRNNTQVRISGRKRKSRDDGMFEYH